MVVWNFSNFFIDSTTFWKRVKACLSHHIIHHCYSVTYYSSVRNALFNFETRKTKKKKKVTTSTIVSHSHLYFHITKHLLMPYEIRENETTKEFDEQNISGTQDFPIKSLKNKASPNKSEIVFNASKTQHVISISY